MSDPFTQFEHEGWQRVADKYDSVWSSATRQFIPPLAFNKNCYHQPCDQFGPRWTSAGTVQEASVAYLLGRELANSETWPSWNAGREYKSLRDPTESDRAR